MLAVSAHTQPCQVSPSLSVKKSYVIRQYREKHHGLHFELMVASSTEVTQRVCEGLLIEPALVNNYVTTLVHFLACKGGTLSGDVSVRHLSEGAELVPIRDREMSSRWV